MFIACSLMSAQVTKIGRTEISEYLAYQNMGHLGIGAEFDSASIGWYRERPNILFSVWCYGLFLGNFCMVIILGRWVMDQ